MFFRKDLVVNEPSLGSVLRSLEISSSDTVNWETVLPGRVMTNYLQLSQLECDVGFVSRLGT